MKNPLSAYLFHSQKYKNAGPFQIELLLDALLKFERLQNYVFELGPQIAISKESVVLEQRLFVKSGKRKMGQKF